MSAYGTKQTYCTATWMSALGAKWTFGSVLEKGPVKRFRHEAMFIASGRDELAVNSQ